VTLLLTGGAGFIGTSVRCRLTMDGVRVRVFDIAQDRRDDVCDLDRVRAAIQGCDVLVHLAAKVGLGVDVSDLDDYVRQNDLGTAVVLRAAAEAGVRRVVYASSMVVYGEGAYRCPRHGPVRPAPRLIADLNAGRFDPTCPACGSALTPMLITESANLDPRNAYAATKLHGEHLGSVWSRETGGRVAGLRFHNVYGPGMPRHTPYAGVAALFLSQLVDGMPCLVFEDGAQQRDFVHVNDVAAAVVAATTARLDDGLTPLNIGSGSVTTIGQMAVAITAAIGGPEPVITGRYRLGDVRHITADSRWAQQVLSWRPRVSLDQGVETLLVGS
jgi:dTDP-L-rhamnose 4-epimerase